MLNNIVMSYNYCFMWNLHNINENFKLLFNQFKNLSILRVDFNFSFKGQQNKQWQDHLSGERTGLCSVFQAWHLEPLFSTDS